MINKTASQVIKNAFNSKALLSSFDKQHFTPLRGLEKILC